MSPVPALWLTPVVLAFGALQYNPARLLYATALLAGGLVAIGLSAVAMGLPYLKNFLPLGQVPGAVSSSGTIALISFFVGIEVAAAFILIVGELLEQTLLIRQGGS